MAIIDIIAVVLLVASLIGMAVIVGRKFPLLATIDTKASDPQAVRKTTLIEQRLKRKFTGLWSNLTTVSQPWRQKVSTGAKKAQQKLVDMEHEYRIRSLPVLLNRHQQKKIRGEVDDLVAQAREFLVAQEPRAAEDKAMQAIRLDPKSVAAFELLGELYLQTKEFQHAREVYKYLLKLGSDSDQTHGHLATADLGEGQLDEAEQEMKKAIALNGGVMNYHLELARIERQLEHWPEAFDSIQAAARLEPNHPKVLDEMIEICLANKKKEFCVDAINKIRSSNPNNKKIPEWEKRLAEIE